MSFYPDYQRIQDDCKRFLDNSPLKTVIEANNERLSQWSLINRLNSIFNSNPWPLLEAEIKFSEAVNDVANIVRRASNLKKRAQKDNDVAQYARKTLAIEQIILNLQNQITLCFSNLKSSIGFTQQKNERNEYDRQQREAREQRENNNAQNNNGQQNNNQG